MASGGGESAVSGGGGVGGGSISYHGVTLYAEEVFFIAPRRWLNDSWISFWLEYLAREVLPLPADGAVGGADGAGGAGEASVGEAAAVSSEAAGATVTTEGGGLPRATAPADPDASPLVFMHPGAVHLTLWEDGTCPAWRISHDPSSQTNPPPQHPTHTRPPARADADDLAAGLSGLALATRDVIFAPINDAVEGLTAGGGSHWSLLVWRRPTPGLADDALPPGGWSHWDSVASSRNAAVAARVAASLSRLLPGAPAAPRVAALACQQQTNGSDCGVFVAAHAEALARAALAGARRGTAAPPGTLPLPPIDALAYRARMAAAEAAVAARGPPPPA